MSELLSPIHLRDTRPAPLTPSRPTGVTLDQTNPSVPAAPVKKYPCRKRCLTDRGVQYWQDQMRKADFQDPFASSLVRRDGTRLKSFVEALASREEGGNNTDRRAPRPRHQDAETDGGAASARFLETSQPNGQETASGIVGKGNSELVETSTRPSRRVLEDTALRAEVSRLRLHIGRLERAERRLQHQLRLKSEGLKDTKVVVEEAQTATIAAEECASNLEQSARDLRGQADRYQGWWLTEYHSLKVVLVRLPERERQDFKHIADASRARFETYYSDL